MESITESFLSDDDEKEIIRAIAEAELNTSGEIRIHIENHSDLDVLDRAKQVFFELNMDKTAARNGVLFYIGVSDHTFAILGDEGIDKVVEGTFWDSTKNRVIENFKQKKYKQGIIEGVLQAGERLKQFFPLKSDDTNELSNEISRG